MIRFNLKTAILKKILRLSEVDLESRTTNWILRNIENPSAQFTGESTDKKDGNGILIASFDKAKGFTLSGEGSKLKLGLMASQLGTSVEKASKKKKLRGEDFEVVKVKNGKAALSYVPLTTPSEIYAIDENKSLGEPITLGTGDDDASISDNVITLPGSYAYSYIGVLYEYETEAAVRVNDKPNVYNNYKKYILKLLTEDACGTTCACTLIIPRGKLDNNFTINLTAEGTHPFSITALKDYCANEEDLCYLIFGKNIETMRIYFEGKSAMEISAVSDGESLVIFSGAEDAVEIDADLTPTMLASNYFTSDEIANGEFYE